MLAWRLLVWLLSNFVMRGRVLLFPPLPFGPTAAPTSALEQEKFLSFSSTLYPRCTVVSFICDLKVRQGDGNPSSLFVDEKLRSPLPSEQQIPCFVVVCSRVVSVSFQQGCQDKVENHLNINKQGPMQKPIFQQELSTRNTNDQVIGMAVAAVQLHTIL